MRNFIVLLFLSLVAADLALAANGGGGLPWETPLSSIKDSLTGPVAGYIALIAIMVCGAMLIFGGDFSGFVKSLINVVIVCAVILGASSIITNLFGTSGAVITAAGTLDTQPGSK
ncbi:MAG: conjugal transfer protein TrbC [Proteobacteria bacterium]|nr:MAG: conjugal transfer protein TrbC [Pseudomonadota bacterium]